MILRASLLLILLGSLVGVAAAQPATTEDQALTEAKRHFEAGRNAYTAGDYQTAIREFKAAEALRPSPVLAYNIGLANEKLGKRRVAVKYYNRYLEGQPNAANRAEVEGRIAALEKEIAAQPAAANPQAQPQDLPPTATEPPPPPPANAQPGYDPYGQPQPMANTPAQKKKNLWWVWMIVGIGSAALLAVIIGVSVWVVRNSNTYYTGALSAQPSVSTPAGPGIPAVNAPAGIHKAPDTFGITVRF